jgi:acyl-CoA synthetase (AMP-forming)/AMP-acid ligase II
VSRGDRIAVYAMNSVSLVELAWAVPATGATLVPINPGLTTDEARYILRDSGARIMFHDVDLVDIGAVVDGLDVGLRAMDRAHFDDYVAVGSDAALPDLETADDVAIQLYTSGTSGRPKGALHTHATLIQNGLTTQVAQSLGHRDVYLSATPLTHAAAATRIFSVAIDGMAHVILDRFDPRRFVETVDRFGVTVTLLVPTMLSDLVDSGLLTHDTPTSLRLIIYGAAPSRLDLLRRAVVELPCDFIQGYGLTEGSPSLAVLTPSDHSEAVREGGNIRRLSAIGRPVPGVLMRVGPPGSAVGPGEPGELFVKSTKTMAGYWRRDAETADVVKDGWLATGDVATRDEDGYFFIVDRQKDMLISGGVNVYPSEVERVFGQHPDLSAVAVVGVADERWGEVPAAFVVPRPAHPLKIDELHDLAQVQLARYKHPKHIFIVDQLPLNASGKIDKKTLRGWAAARVAEAAGS